MTGRRDYPELTEAVLEQWRTSALLREKGTNEPLLRAVGE